MTVKQTDSNKYSYVILALIAVVALAALFYLTRPSDEPSTRLGKAVDEVSEGLEDAGRELKPERTTGEKIGDAVEDAGEAIQDSSE